MKPLRIFVDIDDTITYWNNDRDYENFKPDQEMVSMINALYEEGHQITLFTARGMNSCGPNRIAIDIIPALIKNLDKIGLKYHELVTHKPSYDWLIDDKAMSPQDFKNHMTTGTFTTVKSYKPPKE